MGTMSSTKSVRSASARTAPRSRENTRERLLEAAVGVFVDKGLKRVTVDDLVGAAGFTRGAFYSNFSSVDEVFFEVFQRGAGQMLAQARERIDAIGAEEFDFAVVADLLGSIGMPGNQWLVLHSEFTLLALRDERAREVLIGVTGELREEVIEVLGDALARLGRRASVPLEQLAEVVMGVHLHAMTVSALGSGAVCEGADAASSISPDLVQRLVVGFTEPDD